MKKVLLLAASILCFSNICFSKEILDYEVRTAPIALLARWATLDLSFSLNDQWAIGPSIIVYAAPKVGNMFVPAYNGYAAGLHAYGYLDSFSSDTWYWGNHLYYENFESYPHNFSGHYELKGFKFNSVAGYQVILNYNLNLLLGAGFETKNYDQVNIDESNGNTPSFKNQSYTSLYIEAKFGYKF
jgi:hypothetical protein